MNDVVRNLAAGLFAIREHATIVCGCCGLFPPMCRCEVEYVGPYTETMTPHVRDVGPCDLPHRQAWFFNAAR